LRPLIIIAGGRLKNLLNRYLRVDRYEEEMRAARSGHHDQLDRFQPTSFDGYVLNPRRKVRFLAKTTRSTGHALGRFECY
jgi:hypothetical protein